MSQRLEMVSVVGWVLWKDWEERAKQGRHCETVGHVEWSRGRPSDSLSLMLG